jgi:hypothetical protein
MKNKLLISTALIGSVVAGSAIAQTSITGSMDLTFKAQQATTAAGSKGLSRQVMGREVQLNVANKGKLSNGWDYAMGFSLEFDGAVDNACTSGTTTCTSTFGASEAQSISNENTYLDLIFGNTTLTMGVDHIQNSTGSAVPQVQDLYDNVSTGLVSKGTNQIGSRTKEAMGFGIMQKVPGNITLSYNFAPQGGDVGGNDQAGVTNSTLGSGRNSSYEVGFTGVDTLNVKGLNTRVFKNKEQKANSGLTQDMSGLTYGVGYTFGDFGVGIDKHISEVQASNESIHALRAGVTYKVNPSTTLGYVESRVDTNVVASANKETEVLRSIMLGYNLGPVAIIGDVSQLNDGANLPGTDKKQVGLRVNANF